jgi:glycosyltransferase involved in cell wall biosynthesis
VHGTTLGSKDANDSILSKPPVLSREILATLREKWIWKSSEHVITVSYITAKEVEKLYGITKKKISVVHNGVDTDVFKPLPSTESTRNQFGWDGKFIVLYVGQISPRKGLSYLIHAASIISKKYPNVIFVIAGGIPSYQEAETYRYFITLKKLILKLDLNHIVKFLGPVPNNLLPHYYSSADIFVLPSLYEAFPKVLLEAMACGRPCVATNVGGVAEVLKNRVNGLLVPSRDEYSLAKATEIFIGNPNDALMMGGNGRETILKKFTWEIAAKKIRSIYEHIK